ncbi:nucleoside deaminase [Flavilitoribacter nigricans]|uniref:tRNA-specific adenosine deaminase n=1 Tax=Flavilitoribacter nigricans (strain ATCC 23147 / DSM 23189 / NBRC 102662 / NCIMB 1420 / SS-2) TaxID=1122177 RepID=A0A2D0N161_FLAN2|nr:nucleoside deaminase [Flavilitoribacter nigricans]PHN02197.1 tRNA-specific adenosine deaminase [Flavilitoribacter nigricans DSM 23189 = NBRC 102662]
MEKKNHKHFILAAIDLAKQGMQFRAGGPFGAIVVKEGKIIGQSFNRVFAKQDPTAHAEIEAIRDACSRQGVAHLEGATLYSSCEPCPMCFSAIYYAKIQEVYYAASHADADKIAGFGVNELYAELERPVEKRQLAHHQCEREQGLDPFIQWQEEHLSKEDYIDQL